MSKYCVTNIIIGQVNDIHCQTCGFGQVLPPHFQFTCFSLIDISCLLMCSEPLPGVLGNTGTVAFIFREQGIFSNYFQGTGELLTRLLGSREHQFTFNNGQ